MKNTQNEIDILKYIKITFKKFVVTNFKNLGKMNPNHRSNCFELYGYDFMITDDFNVLLIEVNTNP